VQVKNLFVPGEPPFVSRVCLLALTHTAR